ncbi:MAG: 1-(5-phosphoribosyl)-5-[(5-phosphoribosylamino)methylideneamino] imidazole-4-carboxamide isomerase [Bacteroidota bacterium]
MHLVPSISVINNQTVRLTRGDFDNEKAYEDSPIDVARRFEEHGIERIHFVDLEGAKKGTPVNYHALEMIANFTKLSINFSGGIHTDGDLSKVFECGAESVTAATIAVYNKQLFAEWIMSYGRQKIALGADMFDGFIRVGGWQKDTKIDLFEHIAYFHERGLRFLKTTDISRDGSMVGPAFDLYKSILKEFPTISLFASGGVRSMDDIKKLADLGVYGVVFGKAFYEGKITLQDLEQFTTVH